MTVHDFKVGDPVWYNSRGSVHLVTGHGETRVMIKHNNCELLGKNEFSTSPDKLVPYAKGTKYHLPVVNQFKYTGEFRRPDHGDWYLLDNRAVQHRSNRDHGMCHIMEPLTPIPPEPEVDTLLLHPEESGALYFSATSCRGLPIKYYPGSVQYHHRGHYWQVAGYEFPVLPHVHHPHPVMLVGGNWHRATHIVLVKGAQQ